MFKWEIVQSEILKKGNMGLSPKDMENAIIKNLPEKTGKSIDEWIKFLVVNKSHADKKEIKIYES